MKITLTTPYVLIDQDIPEESRVLPTSEIYKLVRGFCVRNKFTRVDPDNMIERLVLDPDKSRLANRILMVEFTQLYDDQGFLNPRIEADLRDTAEFHKLSIFKQLGRQLIVRFGLEDITTLANRLFFSYFPDLLPLQEEDPGIETFGKDYWPVLLVHDYLVMLETIVGV